MQELKEKLISFLKEKSGHETLDWLQFSKAYLMYLRHSDLWLTIKNSKNLYWILNDISETPKCSCGLSLPFRSISEGYKKHCSILCGLHDKKTIEKRKQTCLEKYGTISPFQNSIVKNKIKKTCNDRYGTDNPFSNKEIQEKIKQTNLEKHGVEYPMQSQIIKEKIKQTNLEKHGVEYPMQSQIIKEKSKKTCLNRYKSEYIGGSFDIQNKIKQTNLEKHGVENPFESIEIREKCKQSCLEIYGHDGTLNNEEVREKGKQTCLERYGFEIASKSDIIKEKISKTHLDKYFNDILPNRFPDFELLFTRNDYKGKHCKYPFKCKKCGTIKYLNLDIYNYQQLCYTCNPNLFHSKGEIDIFDFIKQYFPNAIHGDRTILNGKEIDVLITEKNIGIEFNGLYWHSQLNGKDRNYHLNKTNLAKEKGIQLIHIYEDEWRDKQEIVKSILKNKLGICDRRIFARKCAIKEITDIDIQRKFLDENHIQGFTGSTITLGMYHYGELLCVMSFKKNPKYEWDMSRFCTIKNTLVVGGFSKMLSYFIKQYNPKMMYTFADKRISNGNLYEKNGFKLEYELPPDYFYCVDNNYINRRNKRNFRLKALREMFEDFDENKSEWENMQNHCFDRIWDCGKLCYVWRLDK